MAGYVQRVNVNHPTPVEIMSTELSSSFQINPADLPDEAVIFGSTSSMLEIRRRIDHLSGSDLPVLIEGESGTGKEVIARFLHTRSTRRDSPFVKVNCAAVPASLLESELFGYEKGSFPNAQEGRAGLVEIASGGTLFLDEIGGLPWDLQGKLLCLLQDGSYIRIGETVERMGQVRIICATNVNLEEEVVAGAFRSDLFHHIDVASLHLPTLRDRRKDIAQLCEYFLQKLGQQFGRIAPRLSPSTLRLLEQWHWPGNLRELENWVARAIILGNDEALGAELRHQVTLSSAFVSRQLRMSPLKEVSRRATLAVTRAVVLKALQANHWNRRKTAEELNMSYRSLLYKLREAGVPQRRRGHNGFRPQS